MITDDYPKTVDQAIERLLEDLTLKERVRIAKMDKSQLKVLHITMGPHIREKFGFWTGNHELMESCRILSGNDTFDIATGSAMIINGLWARLKRTHALRVLS
jgi:hypothetical protein